MIIYLHIYSLPTVIILLRNVKIMTYVKTQLSNDYLQRLENMRQRKYHVKENFTNRLKEQKNGFERFGEGLTAADTDDKGYMLPPDDFTFQPKVLTEGESFWGAEAIGKNYRQLLSEHPVFLNLDEKLFGNWMYFFWPSSNPNRMPNWPEHIYNFDHLKADFDRYGILPGIGYTQHFLHDHALTFELGLQGMLDKIHIYEAKNPQERRFYQAHRDVVLGIKAWIKNHIIAAEKMLEAENMQALQRKELQELIKVNKNLLKRPPQTFWEAVQWSAWYLMANVMYNGSSGIGDLERHLLPFYERDIEKNILTQEDATFLLANLLFKDNAYYQIAGRDIKGKDKTNILSFLFLDAAHYAKIPTNICIRWHQDINQDLMDLAMEYHYEDRAGSPNFISDPSINAGFMKMGFSEELAIAREKSGCHWTAIPGREYPLNDLVKISMPKVLECALHDIYENPQSVSSMDDVWERFCYHLEKAITATAKGIDFHYTYMRKVFPELVMNLCCHGPLEKAIDASGGGVEYYNMCVDATGLATAADSLAAIYHWIFAQKELDWQMLQKALACDFKGYELMQKMLSSKEKFGSGQSQGDIYAKMIVETFSKFVRANKTELGLNMVPGFFSWANHFTLGSMLGATPNGRHAGKPLSYGINPDIGELGANSLTSVANACLTAQSGYGNSNPMHLEISPNYTNSTDKQKIMKGFLESYMAAGGTLINLTITDVKKLKDAMKYPEKYPDLVIRVTGFSVYFTALSRDYQQMIIDRLIAA